MLAVSTTTFSEVLASLTPDAGAFRVAPSEDWRQGRTLFGGLSACLAVAAANRAFPDLPPLRSAQLTFIAPVTGELIIRPRILRSGKSMTFVAADGTTETETALQMTLVCGRTRRSSHFYRALPMPRVEPPNGLPDFFSKSFAPRFAGHFEARIAGGAPPISDAAKPEYLAWLRHRDRSAPDDITSLIALGDAMPPAALAMFAKFAPISTITWFMDILSDRICGAGWHLMQVEAETIGDGYSSQRMALWDATGAPVLIARQNIAIFG
jgi:acyl-CoA thioesterase